MIFAESACPLGREALQRKAAEAANAVQDGVKLCGIFDALHRTLIDLRRLGLDANQVHAASPDSLTRQAEEVQVRAGQGGLAAEIRKPENLPS
jgi:hypothetical protein